MRTWTLLFLAGLVLTGCTPKLGQPGPTPVNNTETAVVKKAKAMWDERYSNKKDQATKDILKQGPCLSNDIAPDWVADIAHQPRTPEDDDPGNQCSAFREGKAHHFIELDQYGNFLRGF